MNTFEKIARKLLLDKFEVYKAQRKFGSVNSVSDFFLYRNDNYRSCYILENPFALLKAEHIEIEATLIFFDKLGNKCFVRDLKFSSFDKAIDFSKFSNNLDDFGAFFIDIRKRKDKENFVPNFRGYAGYRKKNSEFYSYVHGNFGAVYRKNNKIKSFGKIAKSNFFYTPQIELKTNQEFFILNSYESPIELKFNLNKSSKLTELEKIVLPSFGTAKFSICTSNFVKGSLPNFEGASPVLRPLVFESYENTFDVFHT
jgi:hypothetical protein